MTKQQAIELAKYLRDLLNADVLVIHEINYYPCLSRDYKGSEQNIVGVFVATIPE